MLETERNEYLTLFKSNEGLKERCEACTDEKARSTKEIAGLKKSKLGNYEMQCELDFAKRDYESVSSRCNADELKAKTAFGTHLCNLSDTCEKEIQSANKMGHLRAQSKLREHQNHSIETDPLGKSKKSHCERHEGSSLSSMASVSNRSIFNDKHLAHTLRAWWHQVDATMTILLQGMLAFNIETQSFHQIFYFQT